MPRRWAYYMRVAQITKVHLGTGLCPVTYSDSGYSYYDCGCPSHYIPWDNCSQEQNCGRLGPPGTYTDCSGGVTAEGTFASVLNMCCKSYSCNGTFGGNPCGWVAGDGYSSECMFPLELGDPYEKCPLHGGLRANDHLRLLCEWYCTRESLHRAVVGFASAGFLAW